jgi:hypothetical protein
VPGYQEQPVIETSSINEFYSKTLITLQNGLGMQTPALAPGASENVGFC